MLLRAISRFLTASQVTRDSLASPLPEGAYQAVIDHQLRKASTLGQIQY